MTDGVSPNGKRFDPAAYSTPAPDGGEKLGVSWNGNVSSLTETPFRGEAAAVRHGPREADVLIQRVSTSPGPGGLRRVAERQVPRIEGPPGSSLEGQIGKAGFEGRAAVDVHAYIANALLKAYGKGEGVFTVTFEKNEGYIAIFNVVFTDTNGRKTEPTPLRVSHEYFKSP
jgi:hypothetical protein